MFFISSISSRNSFPTLWGQKYGKQTKEIRIAVEWTLSYFIQLRIWFQTFLPSSLSPKIRSFWYPGYLFWRWVTVNIMGVSLKLSSFGMYTKRFCSKSKKGQGSTHRLVRYWFQIGAPSAPRGVWIPGMSLKSTSSQSDPVRESLLSKSVWLDSVWAGLVKIRWTLCRSIGLAGSASFLVELNIFV